MSCKWSIGVILAGALATASCSHPKNKPVDLGIGSGSDLSGGADDMGTGDDLGGGGNGGGGGGSGGSGGSGGTGPGCGLRTCASAGAKCGAIGDGCGGVLQCGSCTAPQTCGGGGIPFQCGPVSTACVPKSCAQVNPNANCGQLADGCGGLTAPCGTCAAGEVCGGGGVPSVCAAHGSSSDGGVPACNTALCQHQMACTGGSKTTLTGTVVVGTDATKGFGNPDPVYNALVYVPNGVVQAFPSGVTCDQCGGAQASGAPLVSTNSAVDGTFTLNNVPCGMDIPLVVQLGRWRRQVTVPALACCASNSVGTSLTRLPRNHSEGDIPLIAFDTGKVDGMECVLRKMGIDDSEFTDPTGGGRVQFYKGNGASISSGTPTESSLFTDVNTLKKYDMVLFPCQGSRIGRSAASQQNLVDYTSAGGRVFSTHYGYSWFANIVSGTGNRPSSTNPTPQPFVSTAQWHVDQNSYSSATGLIDTGFPKGMVLAQWLQNVGASSTLGSIPVSVVRQDVDGLNAGSQRWMYSTSPNVPVMHFTFNTPVGAQQQCGRVVFSDFHVEDASDNSTSTFPSECGAAAPMTPQEKLLEFMLLDLASCISNDSQLPPPSCVPQGCQQVGTACGPQPDGCGGTIQCACPAGLTCTAGQCGSTTCQPVTCQQASAECGIIGDGCGGTVNCGDCTSKPGTTCGGGGVANQCGTNAIP